MCVEGPSAKWGGWCKPFFEKMLIYGIYGHIHRYRAHVHTCSPGRLQGHLWVNQKLDLVFMVHCG